MTDARVLRCGVIGVGRMGRHHARIYAQMEGVELVGVVDADEARRADICEIWGGTPYDTVEALINAGVDAVTIATPTSHHREAAEALLAAGVACLIEKPLAATEEDANAIAEVAEAAGVALQVGHVVRYDPVMQAIASLGELRPRHLELHRISPMTFRSTDVGVVLDMMIHDLDLLTMLVGREPNQVDASAVSVLGDAEDVCNARLVYGPDDRGDGCVANVTASRMAMKTERTLRVISEDIYISADFGERQVKVIRKNANSDRIVELRERLAAGEDLSDVNYLDLVEFEELEIPDVEPLKAQAEAFINAVRSGERPPVDAQAGSAAVRTAGRIVEAARAEQLCVAGD
ncbi:MAG: Gfo/Idh/MocA family oxidoreductase [Phycisphaerales bacterium]|nr:Gfo/Idh/MocA family oxidoreductase [Phycisphaerales bacterium]